MANPAAPRPRRRPSTLALQRLYHWEKTAPDRVVLTQPLGGGAMRDFTWGEVIDEARRMAAHLQLARLRAGQPDRDAVEEQRALADRRLRDLDGRPRLGAAVSDAGRRHDPPDPRAQRSRGCCSSASSTAGRRCGPACRPGCPASACRWRRRTTIRSWDDDRRRDGADARLAGARRRRARDHHVHLGHDRHAQGRDAQLRDLRLGDRHAA